MRLEQRKAQSTLEYAIIIAVVVGALLAMQVYIKRGIQGKLQASTDSIGEQYSAGNTSVKYVTTQVDPSSFQTVDRFGMKEGEDMTNPSEEMIGVSHSEILEATPTTRTNVGNDGKVERVDKKLKDEGLFDTSGGTLFEE